MKWLDNMPWHFLILASLTLGLAPFIPEPHIWEKLKMLAQGTLQRPIDIFDLFLHATPWVLLSLKSLREWQLTKQSTVATENATPERDSKDTH